MRCTEAIEILRERLNTNDKTQAATDLIEWYNVSDLDDVDIELLADLFNAGNFESWACPGCDDRVYDGQPEDWEDFQGVCQIDRVSYPGFGEDDDRCDHCRCHNSHRNPTKRDDVIRAAQ